MTMRYAHLDPEHTQAAVDKLVSSEAVVTKSVTSKKALREKRRKLL
jgi:hypothetical protein